MCFLIWKSIKLKWSSNLILNNLKAEQIPRQKPKPIIFRILEDDENDVRAQFQGKVRFEIEGGGEVSKIFHHF